MMAAACTLTGSTFLRLCTFTSSCSTCRIPTPGYWSRKQGVVICSKSKQSEAVIEDGDGFKGSTRREAMLKTTTLYLFSATLSPALALALDAAPPEFRVYSDDVNKFNISIPQDWQVGAGESDGIKSITAFFPQEPSTSSNISVAITGIGPDFTRLESFGKVDAFAESLVNGLDRSWQRPPGIAAKLIDCKAANGLYYIEYTLQKPGESRRHIYSAIGMASNGWYNRLYTVTGQFVEDESDKFGSTIEKAVQSFRLG